MEKDRQKGISIITQSNLAAIVLTVSSNLRGAA